MEKKFRESKLVVPVAVAAAALGMTACGVNTDVTIEGGKFTSRGYEQDVNVGNRYRIECDGDDLVKKLDISSSSDTFSYRYPTHPACEDGQLTQEDNGLYSHDPFVNEYTYATPDSGQTPSK